jgi:hypothetical protein
MSNITEDDDPDRTELPESADEPSRPNRSRLLAFLDKLVAQRKKDDDISNDGEVRVYIPFGWGMRQLEVLFDADIKPNKLEPFHDEIDTDRKKNAEDELAHEMDALFTSSVCVSSAR